MDFKDYCENLYREWRIDPVKLAAFDSDFNVLSLPEPYYPISKGKREIIVLNNNPGGALYFQGYRAICNKFDESVSYSGIVNWLQAQYSEAGVDIGPAARRRIKSIKEIADVLGYDGVEAVETFFLHSKHFNKVRFLNDYQNNQIVLGYTTALRSYLRKRAVVVVAAIGSRSSLTLDVVKESAWIKYQTEIAGLDLNRASIEKITDKNGKVTSAVIWIQNKYLICNMGSNNIPKNAAKVLSDIESSNPS